MADATPRPKNWLLIKFREWHTWLGVILSVVIVVICLTGIYLNHKDLFHFFFTAEDRSAMASHDEESKKGKGRKEKRPSGAPSSLRTGTDLATLPITFSDVFAIAQRQWGETAIEKIELKEEHGDLYYKIKSVDHQELIVNAGTGEIAAKKERGMNDWGKILKDLHTGKIGGWVGKLIVDLTSIVVVFLTASGVYLWMIPIFRKRRAARERAALASSVGATKLVSA